MRQVQLRGSGRRRRVTSLLTLAGVMLAVQLPPSSAAEAECVPPAPPAPSGTWRPITSDSNFALDFAFDSARPDRVLVAGASRPSMTPGAYLSDDAGATWRLGVGLPESSTRSVAFSPGDPDVLYAGTVTADAGTFYRSLDAGATWCPAGAFTDTIVSLHTDERVPDTVWAAPSIGGLWRSDDRGASWVSGGEGLPEAAVIGIATGTLPSDVLVGTAGGIFRSADGGRTFQSSHAGIPGRRITGGGTPRIVDLAQDPRERTVVYVVQPTGGALGTDALYVNSRYGYELAGRVHKSTDFGATWTELREPNQPSNADRVGGSKCVTSRFATIAVTRSGALVGGGVCGAWVSRDGGATWSHATDVPGSATVARVEVAPSGQVWAGSGGEGIFTSSDDARTFRRAGTGWPGGGPNVCRLEPLGQRHLVASCGLATFHAGFLTVHSADGGRTWHATSGLREAMVVDFASHPRLQGVVLAATKTDGMFRSRDWGVTWERLATLPASATGVIADPARPGVFYAQAAAVQGFPLASTWAAESPSTAVWQTRDGGVTWAPVGAVPSAAVLDLHVSPADSRVLFAAAWADPFTGAPQGGLWRSDDEGRTWRQSQGVPTGRSARAIGFVAGHPSVVLVASDDVYRSTDGGLTFARLSDVAPMQFANPRIFATQGAVSGVVYLGTASTLLRSGDAGVTWDAVDEPALDDAHGVRAVWADPDDERGFYLLAGGEDGNWGSRSTSYGRFLLYGREQ